MTDETPAPKATPRRIRMPNAKPSAKIDAKANKPEGKRKAGRPRGSRNKVKAAPRRRGRPPGSRNKPRQGAVSVLVRMPAPLNAALKRIADRRGMSVSAVINAALALSALQMGG